MLGHSSLAAFIKLRFLMNAEYSWSYEHYESLRPWELEAHLIMLQQHIQEKEAARAKK